MLGRGREGEIQLEWKAMMSECVVPNWNVSHQRQAQVEEGRNTSPHVDNQHDSTRAVPMYAHPQQSNNEVVDFTWANGQLATQGLEGLLPAAAQTQPTTGKAGDNTLESIVHQATFNKADGSRRVLMAGQGILRKRMRPDSERCGRNISSGMEEHHRQCADGGAGAGASASTAFCRDNDTAMMTRASFESPNDLKNKTTDVDDDSTWQDGPENQDEEWETQRERSRSHSTRRSRAAAVHNQSERRRRDRINQKLRTLQKLVPNANKTDKASMLDEVIEYLKKLQAQLHMMSLRNMAPQMMMTLAMQQQIQMSLLQRMGMFDMNAMARAATQSVSPHIHQTHAPALVPRHFMLPQLIMPMHTPAPPNSDAPTSTSIPLHDPFRAFLAQQSLNVDLYSKMVAFNKQQVNPTTKATSGPPLPNHISRD